MKSLPARPSLDSLRKQAKKLARDIAANDANAIARARAQLPATDLPLTQRDAQLVIAREYGYAGWQELSAEVRDRLGEDLDPAARKARRAIHENDLDRLSQLLAEHPALLSWQGGEPHGGLLGFATGAYGDAFGDERERWFTRFECAELLIDAGAVVTPDVVDGLLYSRAKGLLELFRRKGLLPKTLNFLAALGELDGVRAALERDEHDLKTVNEAFVMACRFEHQGVASLLLERAVARDPELARTVDDAGGRVAFIQTLIELRPDLLSTLVGGLRRAFVMGKVRRAIGERDLTTFIDILGRESWLLGTDFVWFQKRLVEDAALKGAADFIVALFELDAALVRQRPAPPSQAIEFALTYAHSHLIPLLTRIWPMPDDLAHAAGVGDLARVKSWFRDTGAPALGDLRNQYPFKDARARNDLHWRVPSPQHVVDTAFAFAVINRHFEVADFLLEHGANINTDWNSHEPASILHHLVFENNYKSMQYLVDHGIDLTIKDYRWNSTAKGWALHAKKDEKMADWLNKAERRRSEHDIRFEH